MGKLSGKQVSPLYLNSSIISQIFNFETLKWTYNFLSYEI